ncbi:MAG: cation-translocating P-type ATPase [Candidatus Babeliales bacterium]
MKENENKKWWTLSVDQVINELQTNQQEGLSSQEATQRLKKFGENTLPKQEGPSIFYLILRQFSSLIIWVLIAVMIINMILFHHIDALAIAIIILLNAAIGFFQEYSAERTMEALRELTQPEAIVVRDGEVRQIPAVELVPGDIVQIEAGNKVPADGRIIQEDRLSTQEAALTGESAPISKNADALSDATLSVADQENMFFMGTVVVRGNGVMVVTKTGMKTELGSIATMIKAQPEEKTPLELQIKQLSRHLLLLSCGVIIIIFFLGLWQEINWLTMLLTALSLAVAAIPEGLPAVLTITLAIGVRKMAEHNALIRRLSSVETLGSTSVICVDKTGTLTKNEMMVQKIWVNQKGIEVTGSGYEPEGDFLENEQKIDVQNYEELMQLMRIGVLCNNAELQYEDEQKGWEIIGDPTEGALLVLAQKVGLEKNPLEEENALIKEIPFESERQRMSIVRKKDDQQILYIKGAPGIIVERSKSILIDGKEESLTEELKATIKETYNDFADQALRVLALAYALISTDNISADLEQDLIFVGLVGMIDPPREEAKKSIALCSKAGIRTIMITGDHKRTAIAIAKQLGLIDSHFIAVTGRELNEMSDEQLKEKIEDIVVYARVSVKHKIRIIQAWKERGNIVAMTGDGVNDAPAIKAADIGIAMGITGTEVTKEASDMIILDDNFASIVYAVKEGRGIYDNIIKVVNYLISTNLGEILFIFFSILIGIIVPGGKYYVLLTPIQILWINLISDGLPALALAADPLTPKVMEQKPRDPAKPILTLYFIVRLIITGMIVAFITLIASYYGLTKNIKTAHTMALTSLILLEFVRIQMIRAEYNLSIFSNWWLIAALIGSFTLQLLLIYIPIFQYIFGLTTLGFIEWGVILACVLSGWILSIFANKVLEKFVRNKFN